MVSLFESIWRDFGLLKIGTVIEDHTLDISGLANFTLQEILGCWRG
jgi:hypothetical protein